MVRRSRDKLAIHGGPPVRSAPFPPTQTIGSEERRAVLAVLDSGQLSGFLGTWSDEFGGGPSVRRCESSFAQRFGVAHAVAVNSATTGLETALAAVGVQPGDEVIVSPYTMSASAACVVSRNAIPVFADVEPDTFGLDPRSVEERITSRTSAIVVVHLFGHPARLDELLELAKRHSLAVVEDAAQSIGAEWRGRLTGTIGAAGVMSLNRHKIVQCGEGGVVLTDDPATARIARMVRNHGETVVDEEGGDPFNTLGTNYRMTEIDAAVAVAQLGRLDRELEVRRALATRLSDRLREYDQLITPVTADGCTHSFYRYAIRLVPEALDGVGRDVLVRALRAEGIPIEVGYVKPLYLQPLYQTRNGRGLNGCPWTCGHWTGQVSYEPGICPTVERLHEWEVILLDVCRSPLQEADIDAVADAFEKVLGQLDQLVGLQAGPR